MHLLMRAKSTVQGLHLLSFSTVESQKIAQASIIGHICKGLKSSLPLKREHLTDKDTFAWYQVNKDPI